MPAGLFRKLERLLKSELVTGGLHSNELFSWLQQQMQPLEEHVNAGTFLSQCVAPVPLQS